MPLQVLFGKRLKEIRMAKKLTQEDLARLTGLSVWHISNLERGVNAPSFAVLEILAEKLGTSIKDFFEFQ